jgi:hypothetical protein
MDPSELGSLQYILSSGVVGVLKSGSFGAQPRLGRLVSSLGGHGRRRPEDICGRPSFGNVTPAQTLREFCGDELCTVGLSGAQWGILLQRAPANILIYLKFQSILASS